MFHNRLSPHGQQYLVRRNRRRVKVNNQDGGAKGKYNRTDILILEKPLLSLRFSFMHLQIIPTLFVVYLKISQRRLPFQPWSDVRNKNMGILLNL
jgi:hypothetical protein